MTTDDRDTSSDTTVPHLVAGEITLYISEDEPARLVPANRYGLWAYADEAEMEPTRATRKKAKGRAGQRKHHLVHVPSGQMIAAIADSTAADELARALAARCPNFGSSCSLGDTPDDGDEVHAMVTVIADVAPGAVLRGGEKAGVLVKAMKLAARLDAAGAWDEVDEPGAAA